MKKLTLVAIATALTASLIASATPAVAESIVVDAPSIRLAYAGDSTTAQSNSWRASIDPTAIELVPGYAKSGYTSGQVLAQYPTTSADVVIIKLGINDIRYNTHSSRIIDNIKKIIKKNPDAKVLISAICPNNATAYRYGDITINRLKKNEAINVKLKAFAAANGYSFIDPDAGYRRSGGGFRVGYTNDGTHPNSKLYAIEAAAIEAHVRAMFDLAA